MLRTRWPGRDSYKVLSLMESIVKHMEASPKFHLEITPGLKNNRDGCAAGGKPGMKRAVWLNKALMVELT